MGTPIPLPLQAIVSPHLTGIPSLQSSYPTAEALRHRPDYRVVDIEGSASPAGSHEVARWAIRHGLLITANPLVDRGQSRAGLVLAASVS